LKPASDASWNLLADVPLPFVAAVVLQLTDVDPPYGKAPTAQLADKLAGEGTAGAELFDGPREMVLETQVRAK
jgi:hypothetical protein